MSSFISDEREYRANLDAVVARAVPLVCFGIAALYFVYGLGHLRLLWGEARTTMAVAAFASTVLLLISGVVLTRMRPPDSWAHALGGAIAAVVLFNSLLHLVLTGEPEQTTNLSLLIIGVGLFFTSTPWLFLVVAVTVVSWVLVMRMFPGSPLWAHFAFNLVGAMAISVTAHVVRLGTLIRGEKLRRQAGAHSEELKVSEERFALALAGSNDGIYDWDIVKGEVYFSPRFKEILGNTGDEIGSDPDELLRRVHPDDVDRVRSHIVSHLDGGTPYFEEEYRVQHEDGSYRWVLSRGVSVRDDAGKPVRMSGSLTDMTRRGVFDPLTGLPNRTLLLDRLDRMLTRSSRYGRPFSLLFMDLDRFKMINDSVGHQAGDQLLIEVSERLMGSVRASDTVSRLGGDEFVIILESLEESGDVHASIARIEEAISGVYDLGGREVYISASIGAVIDTEGYETAEALLRDADTAMYEAKERAEGTVIFDVGMREAVDRRLQLESELRVALRRGEFMLRYQPIVELSSAEVRGLEALVRWNHPERGVVGPREFIPLMEETGMIMQLGTWVLHEACTHMSIRCQLGGSGIPVSVNLSSRQLADEDFADNVAAVLTETGLDPSLLRLEITESAIIENADRAAATLRELQNLGVKILMDDFGTGHSSLAYLHSFPIDALKIDQSFIERISLDQRGAELVRTIINLAENLGLNVVAEGIETTDQLRALRALDCAMGQGYLFAMPSGFDQVEAMHAEISSRFGPPAPAPEVSREEPAQRIH